MEEKTTNKSTTNVVKGMAKTIKQKLDKQEQITVVIPIDPQNKHFKYVRVQINGYTLKLERGKEIKVAKAVKDILKNGGYLGM